MNIGWQNFNRTMAGREGLFGNAMMKSTAQKLERQAQRDSQLADLENQKRNLKSVECSTPEEAARILDMLHSYEEGIAAVKAAYNNAQMFHLMDEAIERGEQIADAIEKSAPKTEEERRQEAVEETLGTDAGKGLLNEILEETLEKDLLGESPEEMTAADTTKDILSESPEEPALSGIMPAK